MTARARVHSTCSAMAVAPDTANDSNTARRAAGETTVTDGFAGAAAPASTAVGLIASAAAGFFAGTSRLVTTMAMASEISKLAAIQLVLRMPTIGRKTKPARNDPATAPNRLMA